VDISPIHRTESHLPQRMRACGYTKYVLEIRSEFKKLTYGGWGKQHLARFEPAIILEITDLFQAVVDACEKQSQQPKDIPSYFARFFSHLVRNSEGVKSPIQQVRDFLFCCLLGKVDVGVGCRC
jgi:hypothetical protein